ncbi:dTMP kinase [Ruminococcaceae bacterium YRB3002]|nr:dTMP kinase [Ruminococcaceae bacterium YRB3002]
MSEGLFITFEGIDGCGKSTQIRRLCSYLEERGISPVMVREPGGTVVGEKIREILLDKKNDGMGPVCELLLFEAARAQITEEVIRPSLEEGRVVICDRFFDSTFAYQGHARGLGDSKVSGLNLVATSGLSPDVTFVLDIDPYEALERRGIRGEAEDRMEALGVSFQDKVREGYLMLCERFPDRVVRIDASGSREDIASEIAAKVGKMLDGRIC